MQSVIVVGAGLAGLSAAVALADSGFSVDVFESRPYPGGRATSYSIPSGDGTSETLDNCQHILLHCCQNLLDFYRRLGVSQQIDFHDQFYFIEPGGRISYFRSGVLPAPAHFLESFFGLAFLNLAEKTALVRGLLAIQLQYGSRSDLDGISMAQWLHEQRQPERVVERFWRQILVSAVNEELDRMAASHGFQVIKLGFLGGADSYKMGVPAVPLGELYSSNHWRDRSNVRFHFRRTVESLNGAITLSDGATATADFYLVSVPFERASLLVPEIDVTTFQHSPITGIHLWFDRPVTDLPHATLLDRTIQWMFNKGGGKHIQLVVSASRSLISLSRNEVVELACRELAEFFPLVKDAQLIKSHVVKELRATFSAAPGLETRRPGVATSRPDIFLAGDWTRTGWPSTMEGAVRSGYIAAEAICSAAGKPQKFCIPDAV
ncbi:MAG: FAD-dependent oxidoreductase [Bryobacteraceae bacterium]|nr:FAD-dependent oxidoreductase [Bryobacteraceae bacterium]